MDTWFWILGRSLTIVTVIGNGFIIFLVCRTRRLRTKTNAFFVSLAVANFCVGLSAVPSLFVCEKTTGCDPEAPFANRVDHLRWLFTYASVTNLCSLVLDRFIAVVKPLKYLLFMTRKRVSQLIFFLRYCQFLLCPDVLTWLVFIVNISVFVINSWIIMIIFEILPWSYFFLWFNVTCCLQTRTSRLYLSETTPLQSSIFSQKRGEDGCESDGHCYRPVSCLM